MRRFLLFLPLLALAPAGYFLGFYLDGVGVLGGYGMLASSASLFLLPWAVAALFLTIRAARPIRIALFVSALVAQGILVFKFDPPGATVETMGFAHRLRREFPFDQMRTCAASLVRKQQDRTLVVRRGKIRHSWMTAGNAVLVDDSELPVSLRGRFDSVVIQQDQDTGEARVYFALDGRRGIVCDSRKQVRDFYVCSMADGVHAYRFQRP